MSNRYRSHDLALAIGQSDRTAQRILREKFPRHEGWWVFTQQEFDALVAELKTPSPDRKYGIRRRRVARKTQALSIR